MICHICHSDAVGQCKDCGRFYCPDHGDIRCVKCRGGEKADPFPDLEPGPCKSGIGCYVCQGTAVGSCTICGKFYCPEHGGKQQGRRGLCEPCQQSQNSRVKMMLIIAVVWTGIMISAMIYFARSAVRNEEATRVAPPQPPQAVIPAGSAPLPNP
jgi:hypothetical protein